MTYYSSFIKKLEKINIEELFSEKFLKELDDFIANSQNVSFAGEASYAIEILNKKLEEGRIKERDVFLFKKYQELIKKLKIIALPSLPFSEFCEVLSSNLDILLLHPYLDAREIVRLKLLEIPQPFRDEAMKEIREAFKMSKALIGKKEIQIEKEEGFKKPTVANWLKDYTNYLGAGHHSHYEIIHYVFGRPNTESLDILERGKLQRLLELYEDLKVSTYELGAIDNLSLETFLPQLGKFHLTQSFPPRYRRWGIERKSQREELEKQEPVTEEFSKEKYFSSSVSTKKTDFKSQQLNKAIEKLNSIEGLNKLSVEDFRVFSRNSQEAARFVFRKIKKMILDYPNKQREIREAFLDSPLYRLCLSVGKEALDSKKLIKEIEELRRRQNRPYLTEEEYKAVMAIAKAI